MLYDFDLSTFWFLFTGYDSSMDNASTKFADELGTTTIQLQAVNIKRKKKLWENS